MNVLNAPCCEISCLIKDYCLQLQNQIFALNPSGGRLKNKV